MNVNPEGLIPIFAGILAWFMATDRFNPSKDPIQWEQWRLRWGPKFKILAPLVILFGIAQFFGIL